MRKMSQTEASVLLGVMLGLGGGLALALGAHAAGVKWLITVLWGLLIVIEAWVWLVLIMNWASRRRERR